MNDRHAEFLKSRAQRRAEVTTEFLVARDEFFDAEKELKKARGRCNAAESRLAAIGKKAVAALHAPESKVGFVFPDLFRFVGGETYVIGWPDGIKPQQAPEPAPYPPAESAPGR